MMDRSMKPLGGLFFWMLASTTAFAVPVETLSDAAWKSDPQAAEQVQLAQPMVTRSGLMRFGPEAVDSEVASAVLADRLLNGGEGAAVRMALADAIRRSSRVSDYPWSELLLEQLPLERDPEVRAVYIETLRHGPVADATAACSLGLADQAAEVRAAAVRTAGYLPADAGLEAQVVNALGDSDLDVRTFAARSVGWLGFESAWTPLIALLDDAEPLVRLRAVRALSKINPEAAAQLRQVQDLVTDPDAKVSRAASQVTAQ